MCSMTTQSLVRVAFEPVHFSCVCSGNNCGVQGFAIRYPTWGSVKM